jgi:hypothetical protein
MMNDAAISLEILPDSNLVSYLIIIKFGQEFPSENSFDFFTFLCSNKDFKVKNLNTVYSIFLQKEMAKKGKVFYAIRELNSTEFLNFCIENKTISKPPAEHLSNISLSWSANFQILIYSIGCYYMNPSTGKWEANGMNILNDSNIMYSHCSSTHLTEFAGGLVVLPSKIDFNYAFKNASINKNPIIYATVFSALALFALVLIFTLFMDKRDKKKIGMSLIENENGNYFYEVIFFTGLKREAGTDSNVELAIFAQNNESSLIKLQDDKRKCFRRGGIDSFIIPFEKKLENINYIRVLHDNSGKGASGSWFLDFVIINDLQTAEKYYFICEKWFALEKGDGLIDRILTVSTEKEKKNPRYLIKKQTKFNLKDGHLWYSLFARPIQTSFTRTDRAVCCFVLLFISMLFNILYYDLTSSDKSVSSNTVYFGPFVISKEQVIYLYHKI